MKLLEVYSNSASVEIKYKPQLPEQFYPVPTDRYITIQNSSGMNSKDYDLYQEVINLIHPYLQQNNIQIIQLGAGEVKPLNNVINLVNQTNFAQSVYILKRALCHAGNDSWCCHAAVDLPVVSLYSSTAVSAHSPYFYHPKSIFIESHRGGKNPSYQAQENPKTINLIKPELVAKSILSVLNISNNITQSTLFIGSQYQNPAICVVPDFILPPSAFPNSIPLLRLDWLHQEDVLIESLKLRKYAIYLSQPIQNIEALKILKPNVESLIYEIDNDKEDLEFIQKVQKLGINIVLLTRLNRDALKPLLLSYLDVGLIHSQIPPTLQDVKNQIKTYNNLKDEGLEGFVSNNLIHNKTKFISSKIILSAGKVYNSKNSWKHNKPNDVAGADLLDLEDFEGLNDVDNFLVYND